MLKELLRIFGVALIVSGLILYFVPEDKLHLELQQQNRALETELNLLKGQYADTSEELAKVQMLIENQTAEATAEEEEMDESSDDENTSEDVNPIKSYVIDIEPGTSSKELAAKLEAASIIDSADEFNDYLKNHNLSTKIQIGQYQVNDSMSVEMIAKLITTLQ